MMDENGQLHLLQKDELAGLSYEPGSLMPADYRTRLSQNELQNLIAYLKSLRQRDWTRVAGEPLGKGLEYERLKNLWG